MDETIGTGKPTKPVRLEFRKDHPIFQAGFRAGLEKAAEIHEANHVSQGIQVHPPCGCLKALRAASLLLPFQYAGKYRKAPRPGGEMSKPTIEQDITRLRHTSIMQSAEEADYHAALDRIEARLGELEEFRHLAIDEAMTAKKPADEETEIEESLRVVRGWYEEHSTETMHLDNIEARLGELEAERYDALVALGELRQRYDCDVLGHYQREGVEFCAACGEKP